MTFRSDLPITNTHLRTSLQTGIAIVVSEDCNVRRRLEEKKSYRDWEKKNFLNIFMKKQYLSLYTVHE